MLTKLIKHEFKAVSKLLGILVGFMVVMTLLGALGSFIIAPILDAPRFANANNDTASTIVGILTTVYFLAYALAAFVLAAGTFVYLGVRFYHSMYGNSGYLTNTLPATPIQLITAKLVTAVSWVAASITILFLCVTGLITAILLSFDDFTMAVSMANISSALGEANDALRLIGLSFGLMALLAIVAIVNGVLMMYGACALGQLVKKHRILAAVGFYYAINIALQFVVTVVATVFITMPNALSAVQVPSFRGPAVANLIMMLATGAGLFVLTHFVTAKKLNLE